MNTLIKDLSLGSIVAAVGDCLGDLVGLLLLLVVVVVVVLAAGDVCLRGEFDFGKGKSGEFDFGNGKSESKVSNFFGGCFFWGEGCC
jgi:hypothetical protein